MSSTSYHAGGSAGKGRARQRDARDASTQQKRATPDWCCPLADANNLHLTTTYAIHPRCDETSSTPPPPEKKPPTLAGALREQTRLELFGDIRLNSDHLRSLFFRGLCHRLLLRDRSGYLGGKLAQGLVLGHFFGDRLLD